ncbi:hypothetical protein DFQ27_005700 [Actinomortierella ambigua]|uniref:Uncharacterized protein n=1 Tax=Actinomortierella ambigua TaxID=1343610 RepID=A0A9P6Q094_9FUNG|nr:hypothetical protein DFQ27_005700 [Actinomortierella ambigua]
MSDAEQLDTRLSKLLVEHQHYRKLLCNYIGRAISHCTWYIDEDSPSFFRQMDRAEKMIGLLWYIQSHADQSRYKLERSAQLLLSMAESFLASPAAAAAAAAAAATAAATGEANQRNGRANGTHPYHHPHHPPFSHFPGQHHHQAAYDIYSRVAGLADEMRGALRFWQDQSDVARLMEPKVTELERFARERSMDLSRKEATIEEKAGALRIANDQSRKVTEVLEVFLDQWLIRLQSSSSNAGSTLAPAAGAPDHHHHHQHQHHHQHHHHHRSRDGGGGGGGGSGGNVPPP